MWEKADIRFDALSAGLPEKNKLVERVSELQRKIEEVRYKLQNYSKSHRTYSTTGLAVVSPFKSYWGVPKGVYRNHEVLCA